MLRKSSQNFWGLFRGFYASSSSLSSAAPLSHLASQAHAVALSAHQEWTSGSGTNFSFLNNGSLAAGMLLAAASPIAVAQAEEQRSSGSIPVSETATHPLDDEAITNEHTAKMSMARIAALEYYQAGKYELAERKFKEAVEESILGFESKDPHVASAKNNLAEFYRNTGQHKKAEQLYKEALELLESAFGEKHWLYVSAMHNLALSYEAIGDLAAAKETMEHVMRLRLEMFGPLHFLYADTMFALGNILLKQADLAKHSEAESATGQDQSQQPEVKPVPKRSGWWFRWRGWRKGGGPQSSEREALGMMQDAVGILESAENVQTNVVVLWLEKLASEFQERGQVQEAVNCIRKAMYHFGTEKGEGLAQASQLSDNLVELLLQLGDKEAARDAVSQCLAARMQLFGRQLVVCQSMLRLANLEVKLGKKGDLQAAMQHATNAANLSGELTDEYAKQVDGWKGRLSAKNSDMAVKRVRAAFVHATAHKFLADHSSHQDQARSSLRTAIAALRPSAAAASRYISDLSASSRGNTEQQGRKGNSPPSQLDALADLFVDSQLLLLDCVESLGAVLGTEESAEQQKLGQIADDILKQLGV